MSLIEKLLKNSTIKETAILSESKLVNEEPSMHTDIPILNVALSGKVEGGLQPGLLMIAGPSKHFKSNFALLIMKMFQDQDKDAVVLFYDSEFGTPKPYWDSMGIDRDRVIHSPIDDVEEWKIDCLNQLMNINKGDKVMIVIDSIGQLASRKEIEDAKDQKIVADMSRAKALKSAFRILVNKAKRRHIPMVAINHTYKEIGMFPKEIVGGGTGGTYGADNVWIIGRQQEKEGTDLKGFTFIINAEKSRFVKEKSKFPITVKFDEGLERYSGLLEVALEGEFVTKPSNGWYTRPSIDKTGKKFRESDTSLALSLTASEFKIRLLQASF